MADSADMRASGWQTVAIPFVAGLETKMAAAVVPAQMLSVLENGVFTKTGSVKKRAGYSAVPDYATPGAAISGARRGLISTQDDLALVTNRAIYSRTVDTWESRGQYLAATAQSWEVSHANRNQAAADVAVTNNVAVVVWKYAANSLYFQCFDATTRAPLSAVTALATATANYPSALALGSNILLFYADTSGNNLKARVIRTADLAASVATALTVTVLSDLDATRLYCVTRTTADQGAIAYLSDGSGALSATGITAVKVNSSGTVSQPVLVDNDTPNTQPGIAYSASTNQLCVAWSVAAGATYRAVVNYETMAVASAALSMGFLGERVTVGALAADEIAAGDVFFVALQVTAATSDIYSTYLVLTGTAGTSTTKRVRHSHIASQGFVVANRACVVLAHESRTGLQNSFYVYDSAGRCMGALEQGTAQGARGDGELPHCFDGHMTLLFQKALDVDDFKAQYAHSGIRMYSFDDGGRISSAEYGAATYLSGCQLWLYDGNAPVEAGMHMFPDVKEGSTVASTLAGDFVATDINNESLISGVQYNYRFYYEWYTATGERIRSLPMQRSFVPSFASGEGEIEVTIPTLRHTLKSTVFGRQAEVSIVVYRSQGNLSSVFYRVSNPDPTVTTGDNRYLTNNTDADGLLFVDSMPDSDIIDNERDYFSLNELLNFPVPGPEVVYATADRLYLAGGGIPRGKVLPSKTHVPGDAAAFAEELEVQPTVDEVTALCALDESVLAFTHDALYLVEGVGPDNTGSGSPFVVSRVTSDVGCTERGSVVTVPSGLLFKSAKGIYSISQQGAVQYTGAPVEAHNSQVIYAAHTVPDTNQVLFLCSDGPTLMYDYLYGQWGTFTQHGGTDAVVYGTNYAYLRNDGTVYVRTPSGYTDAGSPFTMRIRTGRFRPADIQGFFQLGSFLVLGEYKSPHKLAIRIFYDRSDVASSNVLWNPDALLNVTTWGSGTTWGSDDYWGGSGALPDYHFERRPRRQKCSQVAFEFEDVITEQAGASFELTELLLLIKVRPGLNRLSQQRKI